MQNHDTRTPWSIRGSLSRKAGVLAFAVCFAGRVAPSVQAQEGLVQRSDKMAADLKMLQEDNKRISKGLDALRREFDAYRDGHIGRLAQSVCGALNADWGVDTNSWDYGRPHPMTSRTSCATLCSKKEDNNKCDGLVLINSSAQHVTGRSCNFTPGENYFTDRHKLFCCCR